ncbi:hypothetical protein GJ496_010916 [Pomphorhynchus laevis]|nr:hypothetical protein GJ496_010916 [Pomphorhynchus laevis]
MCDIREIKSQRVNATRRLSAKYSVKNQTSLIPLQSNRRYLHIPRKLVKKKQSRKLKNDTEFFLIEKFEENRFCRRPCRDFEECWCKSKRKLGFCRCHCKVNVKCHGNYVFDTSVCMCLSKRIPVLSI